MSGMYYERKKCEYAFIPSESGKSGVRFSSS